MSHDDPFLEPSRLIPHEKHEETGHPDRRCPCGCGQNIMCDEEIAQRMFAPLLAPWPEPEQQDEGFGEPEQKE